MHRIVVETLVVASLKGAEKPRKSQVRPFVSGVEVKKLSLEMCQDCTVNGSIHSENDAIYVGENTIPVQNLFVQLELVDKIENPNYAMRHVDQRVTLADLSQMEEVIIPHQQCITGYSLSERTIRINRPSHIEFRIQNR
jgi:hypothetical protein